MSFALTLDKVKELFLRRQAAEVALEDPAIVEAFVSLRDRAVREIVGSEPDQQVLREDAYQRLRALALVRGELDRAITDHKMAEYQVDRAEKRGISLVT